MPATDTWTLPGFDLQGLRLFTSRFIPSGWLGAGATLADGRDYLEKTLKLPLWTGKSQRARPQLNVLGEMSSRLQERCSKVCFSRRDLAIGRRLGLDLRQLYLLTLPRGDHTITATRADRSVSVELRIKDNDVAATFIYPRRMRYGGGIFLFTNSRFPAQLRSKLVDRTVSDVAQLPEELRPLASLPILQAFQRNNQLGLKVKNASAIKAF